MLLMYSRRLAIALPTGFRNSTLSSAKKIAKFTSWMMNVPGSSERNIDGLVTRDLGHQRTQRSQAEDHIERETQSDDRERFQHADAQEHERHDVRPRLGLTRDRFNGFAGHDTVADGRTEGDAGNDDAEGQEGEGCYQRFRCQGRNLS